MKCRLKAVFGRTKKLKATLVPSRCFSQCLWHSIFIMMIVGVGEYLLLRRGKARIQCAHVSSEFLHPFFGFGPFESAAPYIYWVKKLLFLLIFGIGLSYVYPTFYTFYIVINYILTSIFLS